MDILPFLYTTAFPTTAPLTIVTFFGLYTKKASSKAAFWAVVLGVSIALFWGIALNDPFGIPNIYIAFIIPIGIMTFDVLKKNMVDSQKKADQNKAMV